MPTLKIIAALVLVSSTAVPAYGAEPAHAGHGPAAAATPTPAAGTSPASATSPPPSGKAREAGYRGADMMESTTVESALAVQCAQASAGIVILDRATLAKCVGTPAEVAPAAPPHHQH